MKPIRHRAYFSLLVLIATILWCEVLNASRAESAETGPTGWSAPTSFSEPPEMVSAAPVLLCDQGQNSHAIWLESDGKQTLVYYRTDATGVWSAKNDILSAPSVALLDAAITPDGTLHLAWVNGTTAELMYTSAPLQSASDARKWQPARVILGGLGATTAVMSGAGTIRSDESGRLHIIIAHQDDEVAQSHTLYYLSSNDNGVSWSEPIRVITLVAPEPSYVFGGLALDQNGRIHVAWDMRSFDYASFSQLGYLRSTDGGVSWSESSLLVTGARPFGVAMPAVFAFGKDEIHLTWDAPDRFHKWSYDGGNTWSSPVSIMELGAAFGGFNKLAKDSAGTLHVIAAVGDGVFHATWNGGAWGPREAVDTRSFDPHGQQFVICQGNRLHVAYYDIRAEQEIWYSSKTTNAPELARTAITVSEPVATPTILIQADRTATRVTPTAAPPTGDRLASEPTSAPTTASVATATIVGATTSTILVISVLVATLSRRRR